MPGERLGAKHRHIGRREARTVNQDGKDGKSKGPVFLHPAHPHQLAAASKSANWSCEICFFQQKIDGEQKQRIKCTKAGCEYNICAECLNTDYNAWYAHENTFLAGEVVSFAGLKYMGEMPVSAEWPSPDDLFGNLALIDRAQKEGDLPYRAKESRLIHFTYQVLSIVTDLQNMVAWEEEEGFQTHYSFPVTQIMSISYYDDHPQHVLCIVAGDGSDLGTAHFLQCQTGEVAESICETVREGLGYIFTQSLMEHMDDAIDAGAEGRQTALEAQEQAQAKLRELRLLHQQQQRPRSPSRRSPVHRQNSRHSPVPRGESPQSPTPDESDAVNRRASIFDVFSLKGNKAPPKTFDAVPEEDVGPPAWAREAAEERERAVANEKAAEENQRRKLARPPPLQLSRAATSAPAATPTRSEEPERALSPTSPPSNGAVGVVQDYMGELQKSLSTTELRDFALLLRTYRTGGDFDTFTQQLLKLYGPARKNLVPGLEAFIPPDDKGKFQRFLMEQTGK